MNSLTYFLTNGVLPSVLPILLGGKKKKKPVIFWRAETVVLVCFFSATFDLLSCLSKQFHARTQQFFQKTAKLWSDIASHVTSSTFLYISCVTCLVFRLQHAILLLCIY